MKRIAIFASGAGTNAENIINYFQNDAEIKVHMVLTNNKNAKVLEKAKRLNVKTLVFNKTDFTTGQEPLNLLKTSVDFIVLAGFLWKIPLAYLAAFPNRIINIHPALLPKYGGRGMYGNHVHEAVVLNNEKKTGITIHFVNENYDEGAIIFQKSVELTPEDTSDDVAKKVHRLEYAHYPSVLETVIKNG